MVEKHNFYKSIFKGTLLFGGVQIFQILASLIRGKFTAIYLGPSGLGILSIFSSSLAIIITIFSFGFASSIVRNLAIEKDENKKKSLLVNSQWLLLFISILGAIVTVLFSNFLSEKSFGNRNHSLDYKILSIYVFLSIFSGGIIAILQGLLYTKKVANVNLMSTIFGLFLSLPLLYFLKIDSLILLLIIPPFLISFFSVIFILRKKIGFSFDYFSNFLPTTKIVLNYGVVITLSQLLGNLTVYLINIIVASLGDIQDIGFYNSASSITSQSIGLVFSSMSIDYAPKLTSVCDNHDQMVSLVNQQGIITMILSIPILCLMLLFTPFIIKILLSPEFLQMKNLIQVLIIGMFFKSTSFALGYVSFSKGDKKLFFIYEGVIGNLQNLVLVYFGYKNYGLNGLGYAFFIHYMLYFITIFIICKLRYRIKLNREFIKYMILGIISLSTLFILLHFESTNMFILANILSITIVIYCIIQLQNKMNFLDFIKRKFSKSRNMK